MKLKDLVGCGDKIGVFMLPFIIIAIILYIYFPDFIYITNNNNSLLKLISLPILLLGIVNWIWSVVLILTKIPRKELITKGPYKIVKHPLYTGMAFLVFPFAGFLLNTWLGIFLGAALYIASRKYSPDEEKMLNSYFGKKWKKYSESVLIPWL